MDRARDDYTARRRKEDLAFLVVRFLKAYQLFDGIYASFRECLEAGGGFEHAGLFNRIKNLEETIMFDVKEKAHYLFRGAHSVPAAAGAAAGDYLDLERVFDGRLPDKREARAVFTRLRRSLVAKSLDSYIGTGFHMFMILRESFYQLEIYVPQYLRELEYLERVESLYRLAGYEPDEEEARELQHMKQVVLSCQSIASETRELATIAIERCRTLFRESARIIRHSIEEGADNEVLVLNLLREETLLEAVYGAGALDAILQHMFRGAGRAGQSGREKALRFARRRCGNTECLA